MLALGELALNGQETRTPTMQSPIRWNPEGLWKLDYLNLQQIGEAELQRQREKFDRQKELARPYRVAPSACANQAGKAA